MGLGGGKTGDSGPAPWSLAEAVKVGPQKGSHEKGLYLLGTQGRGGGSIQNAAQGEGLHQKWSFMSGVAGRIASPFHLGKGGTLGLGWGAQEGGRAEKAP